MSLKYALLGFVDMMPITGYDIKKYFDSAVFFYWSATHTQIYKTLAQMTEEGLVEIEIIQQYDHPNKKLFTITEKGKEALRDWVAKPLDLSAIRHALLVQISWADRLSSEEIINLFSAYAAKLQDRLDQYYDEKQSSPLKYARSEREALLWRLTLENGIAVYEAELTWARHAIKEINAFKDSSS